MYGKRSIQRLAVVSALTIFAVVDAHAQTKPVAPSSSSAYDKLSLGNQKVASALYQAQSATHSSRRLTLEQIAAKRRSGQEWGQIFREMKAQGLVHEKSLGQVVARYQQTSDAVPGLVASDNTGGKSNALGARSNGLAGGAAHGVGNGGK